MSRKKISNVKEGNSKLLRKEETLGQPVVIGPINYLNKDNKIPKLEPKKALKALYPNGYAVFKFMIQFSSRKDFFKKTIIVNC